LFVAGKKRGPDENVEPAGAPNKLAKVRGANRKKAFVGRIKSGSRRLYVSDSLTDVRTDEEVKLFYQLYLRHTPKKTTDWTGMVKEWNLETTLALLKDKEAPSGMHTMLWPKDERRLKKFHIELVKDIARRDTAVLNDALQGVSMTQGAPLQPCVVLPQAFNAKAYKSKSGATRPAGSGGGTGKGGKGIVRSCKACMSKWEPPPGHYFPPHGNNGSCPAKAGATGVMPTKTRMYATEA
jgi:hypothetical protein